jgi:hypothetical protein
MPPLHLTKGIIDKACELRAYAGSDSACAIHAGVKPHTFYRWLHFGEVLRDYLDNDNVFFDPEVYRTWQKEAVNTIEKLQRELSETGGKLSKEHRAYLKLWDKMIATTDAVVSEAHQTVDRAKNSDPNWALKVLHWFHPDEYKDSAQDVRLAGADGGAIVLHVIYDNKPDA